MKPYLRWALDRIFPYRLKVDPIIEKLDIRKDDIVAEAGANIGGNVISLTARVRRIYAFEPNPMAFEILKENSAHCQNVSCFNVALGETFATRPLLLSSNNQYDPGASFEGIANHPKYLRVLQSEIAPLDSFNIEPSILILDCEGYETRVLLGAKKTLKSVRLLAIECHAMLDGTNTLDSVRDFLPNLRWQQEEEGFGSTWLTSSL